MKIKQYHSGEWVGALKAQFGRAQFYANLFPLAFSMVAARAQLLEWFPWLTFPMMVVFILLIYVAIMILDYMFVLKAEIEFSTAQSLKHKNPAWDVLRTLEERSRE